MIKTLKKHIGKSFRDFKVLKHHIKQLSFGSKPKKKQIIICFNGVVPHGGLVDRLKGIISFFDIAKQLDYDFYIQFNNPFSLNEFLVPNKVNWEIKLPEVTYNPFHTKILNCINNFELNPLEEIKKSNASTFIVYANIDYLNKNYASISETETNAIWRHHFNTLFSKTQTLEKALKAAQTKNYISFHTRFTSIMGDFSDSTTLVISENEKKELLSKLKQRVNQLIAENTLSCFGFSDSTIFLNYISGQTSTNVIEGQPFHMDNYKGGSTLEAHLKTLLDFFMIANSNAVYFIKGPKMYNSAFSKYAAIIGDKPYNRIEIS